ncbi:MAG: 3-isopropylmalate dehydratase small subunit [Pseudomonadota bacterium]|nr:3-isopropylmalate dehydratase small subunit [Pseudomonadota bacterium]
MMEPFFQFTAVAAPLNQDNLDTDQILPARYLMMPRDQRYGTYVFRDLRINQEGKEIETFVLNKTGFREARIIVAAKNFGCGSSREGAVFTLVDGGFRSIIATSFGDIFYNNSFNNGLLPVILPEDQVNSLREQLNNKPGTKLCVDLENQQIIFPDKSKVPFEIDSHRRYRLLKGLDAVDYTLQFEKKITSFEKNHQDFSL